jgi:hypothetical protein
LLKEGDGGGVPDDEELEVRRLENMQVRESSKGVYMGPIVRFILHLLERCPHILDGELRAQLVGVTELGTEQKKNKEAKVVFLRWHGEFQDKKRGQPLDWSQVTGDVLKRYFANLKGTKGQMKGQAAGKSTKSTARSAVLHLFSMFGQRMSADADTALTALWKGMKRDFQDLKASGKVSIHEGKRAIPMHLFESLLSSMQKSEKVEGIFAHLYSVICLNLGCRSGNTAGIKLSHFSGAGDSIGVQFMHQKNDQEGETAEYLRHMFANPYKPFRCPVLSLGIYWGCHGFAADGSLFGGSKQDNRYLKLLHTYVKDMEVYVCFLLCLF